MDVQLLETGDTCLIETGHFFLSEVQFSKSIYIRLLESGYARLLEDGSFRLLENQPSSTPFLIGFGVSKKLGKPEWDDPLGVYGIYQMRMTKRGKVPIKMKFYVPTNPQTEAQEANRQKFADAMAAWGALTSDEKLSYTTLARKRGLNGWNLFIREYYQNN